MWKLSKETGSRNRSEREPSTSTNQPNRLLPPPAEIEPAPVPNEAPPAVTSPLTPLVPRPERVVRLMTPFAFSPYSAGIPPVMISSASEIPGCREFENVTPIWSPIGRAIHDEELLRVPPWKWYRPFSSWEKPGVEMTIDSKARLGMPPVDRRMSDLSMSVCVIDVSVSRATGSSSALDLLARRHGDLERDVPDERDTAWHVDVKVKRRETRRCRER